ncbi:hypothetical protein Lal_00034143 [Lupinus albus]|uniref:Putative pectinesterase inhibitor domain-containing protein n=1 Tax=Lupinus albus TaxID=3870 RepID=A0A6A5PF53_LUPAL|nr:putative pectinesterase inhibitor domain-containing protein [Lupinus albus]KAF1896445.1 hypothetical protein Lal_00034143 [Lupinus albus]
MNPSTFLSILFTLSLIFISHAPLAAATINLKLYQAVCIEYGVQVIPNIRGCLTALESDSRIPLAKTYVELSRSIIDQAIKNSTIAQNYIKKLMKKDHSSAIKECANEDFDGIIKAFKNALANVFRNPKTARDYLSTDLGYAGKCLVALKDDPKYFKVNVLIHKVYFFTEITKFSLNHLIHK